MGTIRINISNAHYYLNQQPLVEAMLSPTNYFNDSHPSVTVNKNLTSIDDILNLQWEDITISNWHKGSKLSNFGIPMAV